MSPLHRLALHPALQTAAERLAELVPDLLDDPGTSYEELYARIVTTARRAGADVADYARVPWETPDGLPSIEELYQL